MDTYTRDTVSPQPLTVSLQLVNRGHQGILGLNSGISPLLRNRHAGSKVCNRDLPGLNLSLSKNSKQFTR